MVVHVDTPCLGWDQGRDYLKFDETVHDGDGISPRNINKKAAVSQQDFLGS